jgi:methyltransferase-like protein/SAM-dependent methyltransferase
VSEHQPTSYDEIPYLSNPFFQTHPDFLATLATLFGMTPPPVARCRVLELGCASGGNLIPMAVSLPEASLLGIDLSPRQVDDGRRTIETLGLSNIELRVMSILDVDAGLGTFDYIIAHGVYSWVPPEVQDRILSICAENLAPDGLAYVSYNTYPGWHVVGMIREMMGFHVEPFHEPQARLEEARALLAFLIRSARDPDGIYARILKDEAERLKGKTDAYLYHEHLEDVNLPVYFHQFAERTAAKGLQYLEDAFFNISSPDRPEVIQTLEQLSADPIRREQYLDFVNNRRFRRSVLCHDAIVLDRSISPDRFTNLLATSVARPTNESIDARSVDVEEFRTPGGATLSTNNPLVKAVLLALCEAWPRALSFGELNEVVRSHLPLVPGAETTPADRMPPFLAEFLRKCYLSRLVDLHVHMPDFVRDISARPVASPLARLQAQSGLTVAGLLHSQVELTKFEQLVLPLLDGTRDRDALVDVLAEAAATGRISIDQSGEPVHDPAVIRHVLGTSLDQCLLRFAGGTLLVG